MRISLLLSLGLALAGCCAPCDEDTTARVVESRSIYMSQLYTFYTLSADSRTCEVTQDVLWSVRPGDVARAAKEASDE